MRASVGRKGGARLRSRASRCGASQANGHRPFYPRLSEKGPCRESQLPVPFRWCPAIRRVGSMIDRSIRNTRSPAKRLRRCELSCLVLAFECWPQRFSRSAAVRECARVVGSEWRGHLAWVASEALISSFSFFCSLARIFCPDITLMPVFSNSVAFNFFRYCRFIISTN